MPPLDGMDYLVEIAFEVGLYETSWPDIESWSKVTGIKLSPWEANAIKRMANAYTGSVGEFAGNDLPAPWHDGNTNRQAIADATKRALRR